MQDTCEAIKVNITCWHVSPGIFPTEATDSINLSRNGNGDFPMKYVVETSLVLVPNVNSGGIWVELLTLLFSCRSQITIILRQ